MIVIQMYVYLVDRVSHFCATTRPFAHSCCFMVQTDCQDRLVCFQRNSFESVPGCSCAESDESMTDYCVYPPDPEVIETNDFPLGLCEGECDTDFDCRDGLLCFQRNAFGSVPGCAGGEDDSSNSDFCIKEELFVEPVPVASPTRNDPGIGSLQQTAPPSFTISSAKNTVDSSGPSTTFYFWGFLPIICAFAVFEG